MSGALGSEAPRRRSRASAAVSTATRTSTGSRGAILEKPVSRSALRRATPRTITGRYRSRRRQRASASLSGTRIVPHGAEDALRATDRVASPARNEPAGSAPRALRSSNPDPGGKRSFRRERGRTGCGPPPGLTMLRCLSLQKLARAAESRCGRAWRRQGGAGGSDRGGDADDPGDDEGELRAAAGRRASRRGGRRAGPVPLKA